MIRANDGPRYRPASDPDPLRVGPTELSALGLAFRGGWVVPTIPGRLESAWMVRQAIAAASPTAVALDLPESLEPALRQAIARLPRLSVITYPDPRAHDRPNYLPIEPADPLVEAARRAHEEEGLALWLVGREEGPPPASAERLPDPLAAERVGALAYLEAALACADAATAEDDASEDTDDAGAEDLRIAAMAQQVATRLARARALTPSAPPPRVLVVCALHRARRVAAAIRRALAGDEADARALADTALLGARAPQGIALHHLPDASAREVLAEPAFINAAFERARSGEGDDVEVEEPGAVAKIINLFRRQPAAPEPPRPAQAARPEDPYRVADPLAEAAGPALGGRIALLYAIAREARERYADRHGGQLRTGALVGLLRYACRYALTEGALGPDLYHLVIAGRGFADDNFAQELWEAATTYPWVTERPEIEPLELSLRDLHTKVRDLRFRPKRLRRRQRLLEVVKPPPRERRPGEWAEHFEDELCSFPPEDLAIEGYGQQLRRQTTRAVVAAASRTVRFTASLADGVDVRETLRNWHEGALYVRESRAVRDQPGSVVVIFDDEPLAGDDEAPRFPWQMTWQGEGDDEGDMALYATDPFDRVVGPGIGRALYGGFLLHRPPRTLFGVWEDPYFVDAKTKAEVLLLAALDHSRDRLVVYVAAQPPRRRLRQIAQRLDRQIVHLPLGSLAPATLKKLRTFHVLSGVDRRSDAPRYIR
ncbi:MAG: hypothetical protein R3A79_18215 [Nannocystaceae bacterium]